MKNNKKEEEKIAIKYQIKIIKLKLKITKAK